MSSPSAYDEALAIFNDDSYLVSTTRPNGTVMCKKEAILHSLMTKGTIISEEQISFIGYKCILYSGYDLIGLLSLDCTNRPSRTIGDRIGELIGYIGDILPRVLTSIVAGYAVKPLFTIAISYGKVDIWSAQVYSLPFAEFPKSPLPIIAILWQRLFLRVDGDDVGDVGGMTFSLTTRNADVSPEIRRDLSCNEIKLPEWSARVCRGELLPDS